MVEITNNHILFMFAGNATFTITKDNEHFSYKIFKKRTEDDSKIYGLYLKKANKNIYCGYFKILGNVLKFKPSDICEVLDDGGALETLRYTIHNRHNLDENIKVYHSDRCGYCGRLLTDPESMQRGFGPECWRKVKDFTKTQIEVDSNETH